MRYDDFERDVLKRCRLCTAAGPNSVSYERESRAVCAAAARVISRRGPEWCRTHVAEFTNGIWQELGQWCKLGLFVASFFVPAGSLWFALISRLVPLIMEVLTEQTTTTMKVGASASGDSWVHLGDEAEALIRMLCTA